MPKMRPHRISELETAASAITQESLHAAKEAIALKCEEHLRWLALFEERLEAVGPSELHKFARALSLMTLGHLPTRPETCPFCIQYGRDRECRGCGYAATHCRCDSDDSAFSLFIEAFQELGRAIYQDTGGLNCPPSEARKLLRSSICDSIDAASSMLEDLPSDCALKLMERKAAYIDLMLAHLPLILLSEDVRESCRCVREALENYW
ncbi:MAG: hypothetical protein A4E44_01842 [Methanosaeta sp. PtaB.Bin018]|nr:MAG: hypothetical protein A4E44_01842 [Methanosaeta sp. PtaB.Bin018]OPY47728.1 MAG: hypothetical protein A4E46_00317 [Methanosaeta sp. PtaU1.Bin016]